MKLLKILILVILSACGGGGDCDAGRPVLGHAPTDCPEPKAGK